MSKKKNPDPFKTTRYNSHAYVQAWQQDRAYPKIHVPITEAAVQYLRPEDGPLLDLGCSTGLLGRHLADLGYDVYWADRDDEAIGRGVQFGIIDPDRLRLGVLNPESWDGFVDWVRDRGIRTLVARRVLCVLSQRVPVPMMRDGFVRAGFQRILLEGQRRDVRSTHPFGSADLQVAGMEPDFVMRGHHHIDVRFLTKA